MPFLHDYWIGCKCVRRKRRENKRREEGIEKKRREEERRESRQVKKRKDKISRDEDRRMLEFKERRKL